MGYAFKQRELVLTDERALIGEQIQTTNQTALMDQIGADQVAGIERPACFRLDQAWVRLQVNLQSERVQLGSRRLESGARWRASLGPNGSLQIRTADVK
jgi:hypothetical protein